MNISAKKSLVCSFATHLTSPRFLGNLLLSDGKATILVGVNHPFRWNGHLWNQESLRDSYEAFPKDAKGNLPPHSALPALARAYFAKVEDESCGENLMNPLINGT